MRLEIVDANGTFRLIITGCALVGWTTAQFATARRRGFQIEIRGGAFVSRIIGRCCRGPFANVVI